MMPHAAGFIHGVLQNLLRPGRKVQLAATVLTRTGQPLDDLLHAVGFQAQLAQNASGDATFFADQAQEQVFGTNIVMAHALSFLVSQAENPTRPLCKTFHARHGIPPNDNDITYTEP